MTNREVQAWAEALTQLIGCYRSILEESPNLRVGRYEADSAALGLVELAVQLQVRFHEKVAGDLAEKAPSVAVSLKRTALHYSIWRHAIEHHLPRGEIQVRPALSEVLVALGYPELYVSYRTLPQVLHGEPDALRFSRVVEYQKADPADESDFFRVSGQTTYFGRFATLADWALAFRVVTFGVMVSAPAVLARLAVSPSLLSRLFGWQEAMYRTLDAYDRKPGLREAGPGRFFDVKVKSSCAHAHGPEGKILRPGGGPLLKSGFPAPIVVG